MKEPFDFLVEEQENPRLTRELADVYHPTSEDQASLARIRARLQSQSAQMPPSIAHIMPIRQPEAIRTIPASRDISAEQFERDAWSEQATQHTPILPQIPALLRRSRGRASDWRRYLNLVAAILVIALVLSSFAYILNVARSTQSTSDVTPTPKTQTPTTNGQTYQLDNTLHMVSVSTGWAIAAKGKSGDGTPPRVLLRTTNGGKTWENVTPSIDIGNDRPTVLVLNETTAWFINAQDIIRSSLFRTTNGGKTWEQFDLPVAMGQLSLHSLTFINANDGWMLLSNELTDNSMLYQTHDGGKTWKDIAHASQTPSSLPPDHAMPNSNANSELIFTDQQHGYFEEHSDTSMFYTTQDGGRTWEPFVLPTPSGWMAHQRSSLSFIREVQGKEVFLVTFTNQDTQQSAGYIYIGSGATNTWTIQKFPFIFGEKLDMTDAQHIKGTHFENSHYTLSYYTLHKGTWQEENRRPFPNNYRIALNFADAKHGWCLLTFITDYTVRADANIELRFTNDGGESWTNLHPTLPDGVLWIL